MTDNPAKWKQVCSKVEPQLFKAWMALLKDNYPELLEAEDYRVSEWAVHELKAACSNMANEIWEDFSDLFEGGVVWPESAAD